MSGSTVHDLFLVDPFVRAPYHLLEHYSSVKTCSLIQDPTYKTARRVPMENNMW